MQDFNSETLLVFAHRAEASAFLPDSGPIDHVFDGLLFHPSFGYILLCGEGLWSPRERLASVLTRFSEISHVINLGVCAGVRQGIRTGDIFSIRTVYGEGEFKSYSSSDPEGGIDCLSAKERVLTKEKAAELDNFAPLIERELWSVASVCELFKKRWSAYKLVSDLPSEGDPRLCELVKERSSEWSLVLKDFFERRRSSQQMLAPGTGEPMPLFKSELAPLFYLTTTTERQVRGLKQKLGHSRFESLVSEYAQISFERPKERTLALIAALARALNPFRAKLEDEISARTQALKDQGIQVNYPWPLESTHFNLKFQIQSAEDIARLKHALDQFPYEELKRLIEEGKLNV